MKSEDAIKSLGLPWTYFQEEDQIYTQKDDIEYGDYGSIISQSKELVCEFLGKGRSLEIIEGVNQIPKLLEEIDLLHGAAHADELRLIAAAQKAGIVYGGCDTPDDLAEEVVGLRAELHRYKQKLLQERASYLIQEDDRAEVPRFAGIWGTDQCSDYYADLAREQLGDEGYLVEDSCNQ